jgi:hypothetical protein
MSEFKNILISALAGANHQVLKNVVYHDTHFQDWLNHEDFLAYLNRMREKNTSMAQKIFYEALKMTGQIEEELMKRAP